MTFYVKIAYLLSNGILLAVVMVIYGNMPSVL